MQREEALHTLLPLMGEKDIVIATTGMLSRELYENRKTHEKDFLTVGSMGYASSITLGISIVKPERKVFCFDGVLLMHMGALPVMASVM